MKFKQNLIIREKTPGVAKNLERELAMEVKGICWCFSNGTARFRISFEKNSYSTVETWRAIADIDNSQCTIPIERIKISIKQNVKLTASTKVYDRSFLITERYFEGIPAKMSTNGFSRNLNIPLNEYKNKSDHSRSNIFKKLSEEEKELCKSMQPTTNGKNVSIVYELQVEFLYNTMGAAQPSCCIPMFLQAPPLPNFNFPEAPRGWNPKIFDKVEVAMPVTGNNEQISNLINEGIEVPESIPLLPYDPAGPLPKNYKDKFEDSVRRRKF
jgi:hypothetical protein